MGQKNLTLATTTIGDLLLNNKITSDSKLENINLKIPEYQRPYKWTVKNASQLLDDIVEAMHDKKEVYRVGTLILHYDEEKNVYNIVDGLQRTITFSLLLSVLDENKNIAFLDEKLAENQHNLHNIKNNYNAFKRRLIKSNKTNLELTDDANPNKELNDFIAHKCELIVVITSDLSEAFQFFDSQNARGKALYPHDLLKAYHLREMRNITNEELEKTIAKWEKADQQKLSALFQNYLYRLKEWLKGNKATTLTEQNIDMFKGVSSRDNHPYAQYFKGAFAYADNFNNSMASFVTGGKTLKQFQLNAPIIAGKPFFDYTDHYFALLTDIQDNDKYRGYFVNGNEIVKTLDKYYQKGVGNCITRMMFDTVILLYVDRFCPIVPNRDDLDYFEKFVQFAFIWAYSMRAQYQVLGWTSAQNYIMRLSGKRNELNIYKLVADSDSPNLLLSSLSDNLSPLTNSDIVFNNKDIETKDDDSIYLNFLHYFKELNFWEETK